MNTQESTTQKKEEFDFMAVFGNFESVSNLLGVPVQAEPHISPSDEKQAPDCTEPSFQRSESGGAQHLPEHLLGMEYGCVKCQKWHSADSDRKLFMEHLLHQSKHGYRREIK